MAKRNFIIFVFSCFFIVFLGVIFLFVDKDIFIPGFTNDTHENILVNGWPIIIIGVVMLLIGLLMKWSDNNDQRKNKGIKYPPPTEFFDKHHQRYLDE
jgi:uncharacterized membrane protein